MSKSKSSSLFLLGVGLLLMAAVEGNGIFDPTPKVSITDPNNGDEVPNSIIVKGTIVGEIPENSYVWVLVGVESANLWWPQGGSCITPIGGTWSKDALVGGGPDLDIGKEHQIITLWVDEIINDKYKAWVKRGMEIGDWPGLELPSPPSGKVLDKISVIRKRG